VTICKRWAAGRRGTEERGYLSLRTDQLPNHMAPRGFQHRTKIGGSSRSHDRS
jgi:hypothetical protein